MLFVCSDCETRFYSTMDNASRFGCPECGEHNIDLISDDPVTIPIYADDELVDNPLTAA